MEPIKKLHDTVDTLDTVLSRTTPKSVPTVPSVPHKIIFVNGVRYHPTTILIEANTRAHRDNPRQYSRLLPTLVLHAS